VAGEERTRQQHTKKRDERVAPGPNTGGYLGRDGRPAVRNPKCRKTGASPGRAQMIRISPCQTQQCERSARGALAKEWGGKWGRVCVQGLARWGRGPVRYSAGADWEVQLCIVIAIEVKPFGLWEA